MRPAEKEWIPLSEAEEKAKEMGITLSKPTIRKYGKQLGFGVQVGHKIFSNRLCQHRE